MNKAALLFILLLISGLVSCVQKRAITKQRIKEKPVTDISTLQIAFITYAPAYKWIEMQGDLSYDDGSNNVAAALSIRNRKDSIIWASANVLIEALRVMINKDSATILNRIQKNYAVWPVASFSSIFGINNLDFHSVQNLLLAMPPFGIDDKSRFVSGDRMYNIENQTAFYRETIKIDKALLRVSQYRYERNTSQYVVIKYSGFKQTGGQPIPNKIDIEVHTPDKIHIILNVSDCSLQQNAEVPFNIPSSYTKAQ